LAISAVSEKDLNQVYSRSEGFNLLKQSKTWAKPSGEKEEIARFG
jgi:hypothetical protein